MLLLIQLYLLLPTNVAHTAGMSMKSTASFSVRTLHRPSVAKMMDLSWSWSIANSLRSWTSEMWNTTRLATGECCILQSKCPAVDWTRLGFDTHRNNRPYKAVLATMQVVSEVSCFLSEMSWLRSLCSQGLSVPTVAAPNMFLTALVYHVLSIGCTWLQRTGDQFVRLAELWCRTLWSAQDNLTCLNS